jgi:hypothetical protein
MDFKRKALSIAMSTLAVVAVSLTSMPASAVDTKGNAYYEAGSAGASAKESRAERRAHRKDKKDKRQDRRGDEDKPQWSDGNYSRDVDRHKDEDGVGRTTTITNTETGNSVTRERTTSRDPETGAITHTNEITGPEGEKSWSSSTTGSKTDDGRTTTTTVTTPDGDVKTRTTDLSKDADAQSATKSVTHTGEDGSAATRDTTVTRTDDGYTRSTTFNNGVTTDVTATKNPETGEWERDVTRTRGDDDDATTDSASSEVDQGATTQVESSTED